MQAITTNLKKTCKVMAELQITYTHNKGQKWNCNIKQVLMIVVAEWKWCPGADSNHRHEDFQSTALPTELPGHTESLKYAPGHKKGLFMNNWPETISC